MLFAKRYHCEHHHLKKAKEKTMNKVIKTIALMLCLCCFTATSYAQDIIQDLEQVYAKFYQTENLYTEVEVKSYTSQQVKTPSYTEKTVIHKSGENFYYKMGNQEMLMNEDFVIWVDHTEKQLICTRRGKGKNLKSFQSMPDIAGMKDQLKDAVLVGNKENVKHYQFKNETGQIKESNLYLDMKQGTIKKMIYAYNPDWIQSTKKVEINFLKTELNKSYTSNFFSETKFIKEVDKQIQAQEAYRDYEVIVTGEN